MAILKHSSSKNMRYGDALEYLRYKHREDPKTGLYEPILDEYGLLQERDHYALCYLDGYGQEQDPELWAGACMETNLIWNKNNTPAERKQHMYIISHPAADKPYLTREALLEEGKAFVRENLKGYDTLIAVHMDTEHYHIHVAFNSVRAAARQEEPWMMKNSQGITKPCEMNAGGKHQNNPEFRKHCQRWLLEYSRQHGLTAEDNLAVEQERKQQRYADRHREQREQILKAASESSSPEQLTRKLSQEYGIQLVLRGRTYSVLLPGYRKRIRLSTLGITTDGLMQAMGISPESPAAEAYRMGIEKKQYIQWLQDRRQKNSARAEDLIADAAALIAGQNPRPDTDPDFRELRDLIRQTAYAERDLRTEYDKITRLLDRWSLCTSEEIPRAEQLEYRSYLRWCGCDPDDPEQRQMWTAEAEIVSLQIREAESLRTALTESGARWREAEQQKRFRYHREWTISREEALRQELAAVKANRKKLQQIAHSCQTAAGRRIYKAEHLKKAEYFRSQWYEKVQQEKAIRQELRRLKTDRQKEKDRKQGR